MSELSQVSDPITMSGFVWSSRVWNSSLVWGLLSDRKLMFSTFNMACLSPGACFLAMWGDPDGLPLSVSDPESIDSRSGSEDRMLKLFTDSRDERGVWVTETEWFGDPHVVQTHEKFRFSVWKWYAESKLVGMSHWRGYHFSGFQFFYYWNDNVLVLTSLETEGGQMTWNFQRSCRVITGTFGHLNGSQLIAVSWLIWHYGKLLGWIDQCLM